MLQIRAAHRSQIPVYVMFPNKSRLN